MATHGQLTAAMGKSLELWLVPLGYKILYDHGDKEKSNVGNIVCWFGDDPRPKRETELTQLDIAVVKRVFGRPQTVALIEIEESDDRPKTLLGDLFGILLADHVAFRGEELGVDARTELILIARGPEAHEPRMERLLAKVRECRGRMVGGGGAIGHIAGELFNEERQLEETLKRLLQEAIVRF